MDLDARIKKLGAGLSSRQAAWLHALGDTQEPLSTDEQSAADEIAGIVEAMFLMAAVDGVIADEEIDKLAEGIRHLSGTGAVDDGRLMRWLDQLRECLDADGWSRRLREATAKLKSPESREKAFRLAVAVAMVDDYVAHAEAAAIDALAAELNLTGDDATRILREVQQELFGPA
jgi:tellurite resistance protein